MKSLFLTLLLALCISTGSFANGVSSGNLKVIVEDIKKTSGDIRIALCRGADAYYSDDDDDIFRREVVPAAGDEIECTMDDIPYGEYALKVYHDGNGNGKMDKGFFGIPKESYGFSNNPAVKYGMPKYEKVRFDVDSPVTVVTVRLKG